MATFSSENKKFNLLAIECSSELCSVAILSGKDVFYKSALAPREHAYLVLPFIKALMAEAELEFSDLNALAFGQGPGAFTGLRVAASMIQGLALAHDLPIIPVCSLNALAWQTLKNKTCSSGCVVATLDARMGELYWAHFLLENAHLIQQGSVHLSAPEKIFQPEHDSAFYLGTGCRHLHSVLNEKSAANFLQLNDFENCFPQADAIAFMAADLLKQKGELVYQQGVPVYVRNDVAKKSNVQKNS